MATYTVGGTTYTYDPRSTTGYIDDYNTYADKRNKTAEAYRTQLQNNLTNDENKTNTEYDSTAKQNYVKYMQNKKALPEQLATQNVNGGASESALIKLYNNYGTNTATNESARGNALNSLRTTYNNNLTTYNTDLENELASAYATAMQNQRQYDQDQADAELNRFANTVHRYTTWDEYTNWINQLQASSDPYKDIKVAMVMQQRATQFPEGNPATASSGSYYYSGSGDDNSGNGTVGSWTETYGAQNKARNGSSSTSASSILNRLNNKYGTVGSR